MEVSTPIATTEKHEEPHIIGRRGRRGHDGEPLPERRVGEVFVEGPSVTDGYWDDEEATSGVFVDGGVKTGDLGYMSKGELYVTGRLKDTIIVRAVQRDVGLTVSEVVLIEAGSLPKTTSGKLKRSATRDQYLNGTLGRVRRRTDASAVA
jgi:acyl-CoA synthetase (AMP-forming)/AMP-acid ligase II